MEVGIHQKVRAIRKSKEFTQSFMAVKLGVTQKAYSKIECGETQLNWKKLNQLADIFNISVFDIVDTTKSADDSLRKIETDVNIKLLNKLFNQYENKINNLTDKVKKLENTIQLIQKEDRK